ncbi:MAG: methylmalonyl Co-A mutase-associated GTPase MeaB [Flavobacteriales bacterium]|nr:methylmalonyl Co-A mutase-associated GTPase MeaB [Flavobacteriales bacterium]
MGRTDQLLKDLLNGDRAALARAITLVESTRAAEQEDARELLAVCASHARPGARIGITGIPGAGKSTLIDGLGMRMIEAGHRVAVLAVDPSSGRSGGSILGDKTRMERLATQEAAFIRPSPTSGTLGGVARRTRQAITLCEAAGYDRVIVETVGVGQSEWVVDRMTDLTVLLLVPGTGDDLQGIKRGIMESADIVAVHKADGADRSAHQRTRTELQQALTLLPPRPSGRRAEVVLSSALTMDGVAPLQDAIERLLIQDRDSGSQQQRRRHQDMEWLRTAADEEILAAFHADPTVQLLLREAQERLARGEGDPFSVSAALIAAFRKASAPPP